MTCELCQDAPVETLLVARAPADRKTQCVCRHCLGELGDTDWALTLTWPGPEFTREFNYAARWIERTRDRAADLLKAARAIK